MQAGGRAESIKVLSYNLHKGFSLGNTRFLIEQMRHNIRLVDADLVFLQEVVGDNTRHHGVIGNWKPRQFEFLADDVWPYFAYGRNAVYSHGDHGNAILSKHPFKRFDNVDISIIPTSQRGILWGQLDNGVYVLCCHFGIVGAERRYQCNKLVEHILANIPAEAPLILCGDFNDWRGKANQRIMRELKLKEAGMEIQGKLMKTYPSYLPLLAMDRIYYRNLGLEDAVCLNGQPWSRLSDHCALVAEFAL